jgi:hypothetical protein
MKWKFWSKEEDEKLIAFYKTIETSPVTVSEFAATVGRTPRAAIDRAVLLGLTNPRHRGCRPSTGEKNGLWRGDFATDGAKRERAQKMYPLGPCERCGKPGVERHHKDANTGNNVRSNIMIVCRKCHMIEDGRSERLARIAKEKSKIFQPAKPCCNCGRSFKPLRKNRCSPCYQYLLRVGFDDIRIKWEPGKGKGFQPGYSNPRTARAEHKRKMAGKSTTIVHKVPAR